jgi:2-C-methyl-D-erythritol 4-phosphate cytidylyltransferase
LTGDFADEKIKNVDFPRSKVRPVATFAVILPAAGKSSRFHDAHYKKPFAPLDGRAVWLHSAEKFLNRSDVKQVLVVVSPEDREEFFSKFGANIAILGIEVVIGGEERTDSVAAALAQVSPDVEFIAVHDAARPCLTDEWIDAVFGAAERFGGAILAIPVNGTLKKVRQNHQVDITVSREGLWEAQTPQVFRRDILIDAYARRTTEPATDDAQLVERTGHAVTVVPGSPMNIKVTSKEDLRLAAVFLKALPKPKILGAAHPFADEDLWR